MTNNQVPNSSDRARAQWLASTRSVAEGSANTTPQQPRTPEQSTSCTSYLYCMNKSWKIQISKVSGPTSEKPMSSFHKMSAACRASFLCACLTAVKKRSKGCSARASASANARGEAGNCGAEKNQAFSSWHQLLIYLSNQKHQWSEKQNSWDNGLMKWWLNLMKLLLRLSPRDQQRVAATEVTFARHQHSIVRIYILVLISSSTRQQGVPI